MTYCTCIHVCTCMCTCYALYEVEVTFYKHFLFSGLEFFYQMFFETTIISRKIVIQVVKIVI